VLCDKGPVNGGCLRAEGLCDFFNDRHDASNLMSTSFTGDWVKFNDVFETPPSLGISA
jgi:hypothetical protein